MEAWANKMDFASRCVCFYHFGVGLRGGVAQGQFFVDPDIAKVSTNSVNTKIGGISYTVPALSVMHTLVPGSCKAVDVRIDDSTGACIQHCSR